METNFKAAQKFIKILRSREVESLSGIGAHIEHSKETIEFINTIIEKYDIKSILDLGCGDWNWFKFVNLDTVESYEGWDADKQMIETLTTLYRSEKVNFYVKDIIVEDYPQVDLIICKDVLIHMDKALSLKIIKKVKKSSKFFLSTTFKSVKHNKNILTYRSMFEAKGWGFYRINLEIKPFNLDKYEIDSIHIPKWNKNLSLYSWRMYESNNNK